MVLEKLVPEHLQRTVRYVKEYESEFVEKIIVHGPGQEYWETGTAGENQL